MVFSSSCNPGPSSLTDFSTPPATPLKLSSKLENALLKNGLLSPPIISNDQSPIRKEFYSIINENYGTLQELNTTKEKLNISLKTQEEQEKELIEVKGNVSKLQQKLKNKIYEIKEWQNEADKHLKKLKYAEDENRILKMAIFDLRDSLVKLKVESDAVKKDTTADLNAFYATINKSGDEFKHKILKLSEINNFFPNVYDNVVTEFEIKKDDNALEEDSESLHNSSTVSEHSQTSEYYCSYKPEEFYCPQQQESITSKSTLSKSFIPTWLFVISSIIFLLSLWIKINGSLFGSQPHLQVYYTSMPPS